MLAACLCLLLSSLSTALATKEPLNSTQWSPSLMETPHPPEREPFTALPQPSLPVPIALEEWKAWVLWREPLAAAPPDFRDFPTKIPLWPTALWLDAKENGAEFRLEVAVFAPSWVPLPGASETWPQQVKANGLPVPVLPRSAPATAITPPVPHTRQTTHAKNLPAVFLEPGIWVLTGRIPWSQIPPSLDVPPTAILRLRLCGEEKHRPLPDPQGRLWLRPQDDPATSADEPRTMDVSAFAKISDGIPLWLEWRITLVISGPQRQESLGTVIPEGWHPAELISPLAASLTEHGELRIQARPGRWEITVRAHRNQPLSELRFPPTSTPIARLVLLGWQASPEFRTAEWQNPSFIDPEQTDFPQEWRSLPVITWQTTEPLTLLEIESAPPPPPASLTLHRTWWLADDGRTAVYRDQLTGPAGPWGRLDAAPGNELGAVRIQAERQLITLNPQTQARGIEIRQSPITLEATGTLALTGQKISATGWLTQARDVSIEAHLPPGWRALAVWNASWTHGTWLASWNLWDVFLALFAALACRPLFGWHGTALALAAMVLSHGEEGAPRLLWLLVIGAVALRRTVTAHAWQPWLRLLKGTAALALILTLIPFFARQIQQAIFPQLESSQPPIPVAQPVMFSADSTPPEPPTAPAEMALLAPPPPPLPARMASADAKAPPPPPSAPPTPPPAIEPVARLQTGPALPEWSGRTIRFSIQGPVQPDDTIALTLIPSGPNRLLTLLRLAVLTAFASMLLRRPPSSTAEPDTNTGNPPPHPPATPSHTSTSSPPPLPGTAAFAPPLLLPAAALLLHLGSPPARAQDQEPQPLPPAVLEQPPGAWPSRELLEELRRRLLEPPPAFPHAASIPQVRITLDSGHLTVECTVHAGAFAAVPLPWPSRDLLPSEVTVNGSPADALLLKDSFLWAALPPGVHQITLTGLPPQGLQWSWDFLLTPQRAEITAPEYEVRGLGENNRPESLLVFHHRAPDATTPNATQEPPTLRLQPFVLIERTIEAGITWRIHGRALRLTPPGQSVSINAPLWPGENVLSPETAARDGTLHILLGPAQTEWRWQSELQISPQITATASTDPRVAERWRFLISPRWRFTWQGPPPLWRQDDGNLLPQWHPWPGQSASWQLQRNEPAPGDSLTIQRVTYSITPGPRIASSRLTVLLETSTGGDFPVTLPPGATLQSASIEGRPIPLRLREDRLSIPLGAGRQTLQAEWETPYSGTLPFRAPPVTLPAPAANVSLQIQPPENWWLLWTTGPARGPAILLWAILAGVLLAAWLLARTRLSPLPLWQWALLGVGLTQAPWPAALLIVGWLFLVSWRGTESFTRLPKWPFRLLQIALPLVTLAALAAFLWTAAGTFLGGPQVYLAGRPAPFEPLTWFAPQTTPTLPQPTVWAAPVWLHRIAMLAWALWLAATLPRWLRTAWHNFAAGGYWKI